MLMKRLLNITGLLVLGGWLCAGMVFGQGVCSKSFQTSGIGVLLPEYIDGIINGKIYVNGSLVGKVKETEEINIQLNKIIKKEESRMKIPANVLALEGKMQDRFDNLLLEYPQYAESINVIKQEHAILTRLFKKIRRDSLIDKDVESSFKYHFLLHVGRLYDAFGQLEQVSAPAAAKAHHYLNHLYIYRIEETSGVGVQDISSIVADILKLDDSKTLTQYARNCPLNRTGYYDFSSSYIYYNRMFAWLQSFQIKDIFRWEAYLAFIART